MDSLNYASQNSLTSIALPAMGTGGLQFPRDIVAETMFNSVIEFSNKNPGTSVKDVRCVLYDKDQPTIDVSTKYKWTYSADLLVSAGYEIYRSVLRNPKFAHTFGHFMRFMCQPLRIMSVLFMNDLRDDL